MAISAVESVTETANPIMSHASRLKPDFSPSAISIPSNHRDVHEVCIRRSFVPLIMVAHLCSRREIPYKSLNEMKTNKTAVFWTEIAG